MSTQHTRPSTPSMVLTVGLLVAVLAVAFMAMTPRTGRRPGSHDAPCQKCSQYMRGLAVGLRLRAEHHDGSLPAPDDDWVNLLVTDGCALLEIFTSPEDPKDKRIAYFDVPAHAIDPAYDSAGERVLLCEMPGLHPECGVHIAYHDGYVRLHTTEEAERILATFALPGGTPWQTHSKPGQPPRAPDNQPDARDMAADLGVVATDRLPGRLKVAKHKVADRLTLDSNLNIKHAETHWSGNEVPWPRLHGSALWVQRFAVEDGLVMVQVSVGRDQPWSLLGPAAVIADPRGSITLTDAHGGQHPCVGWVYRDADTLDIRYTPPTPGVTKQDLTDSGIQLRNSRVDQDLHLLFLCDADARINSFQIGDEVLGRLEPALPVMSPNH